MASRTQYIIKIYSHEKKLLDKNVFICLLNAVNEGFALNTPLFNG